MRDVVKRTFFERFGFLLVYRTKNDARRRRPSDLIFQGLDLCQHLYTMKTDF
jgi:hypothetical protein